MSNLRIPKLQYTSIYQNGGFMHAVVHLIHVEYLHVLFNLISNPKEKCAWSKLLKKVIKRIKIINKCLNNVHAINVQ